MQSQGYEFVTVRGAVSPPGAEHGKWNPVLQLQSPTAQTWARSRNRRFPARPRATGCASPSRPSPAPPFTTPQTAPDLNGASCRYTGSFLVSPPCTVRAVVAYHMNGSRSQTAERALTKVPAQAPGLQVEGGVLTLENRTPGATVYYTLDGTAASPGSVVYTGPVTLTPGTVISACAGGGNFLTSGQVRATYSSRGTSSGMCSPISGTMRV